MDRLTLPPDTPDQVPRLHSAVATRFSWGCRFALYTGLLYASFAPSVFWAANGVLSV